MDGGFPEDKDNIFYPHYEFLITYILNPDNTGLTGGIDGRIFWENNTLFE